MYILTNKADFRRKFYGLLKNTKLFSFIKLIKVY